MVGGMSLWGCHVFYFGRWYNASHGQDKITGIFTICGVVQDYLEDVRFQREGLGKTFKR